MWLERKRQLSLNGTWKFNPDPYRRCRQQSWWKGEGSPDSFFPCWDMEGLWDIQVPGVWKMQFKELQWYDGDVNYVRDFDIDEKLMPTPGRDETYLCFDGVVYSCDVYLNGSWVGTHDRGYSPFKFRVTDHVLLGSNRLFVLVDNHLRADRVPGVRFDWNNDGGLINGVRLITVPECHVQNFKLQTKVFVDEVEVNIRVWVGSSSNASGTVEISAPELDRTERASVDSSGCTNVCWKFPREDVILWCPESPKLYRMVISTQDESVEDEIGLREISTRGREILLNGSPVHLYGVSVHSEFLLSGRTVTREGIEMLVAKVKELGCNFIRCAHYPYAEIFGRAMDRAGVMWWEEVPVYWLSWIHKDPQLSIALGMLEDTIPRDWNRASLIIWSVSNECAGAGDGSSTESNYGYWDRAVALVRSSDATRLVSSADHGHRKTSKRERQPDDGDEFDESEISQETWTPGHPQSFYDLFDVLAGNLYVSGLGDGTVAYTKFVQMLRHLNKPLMISEFGSMSVSGADLNRPSDVLGTEARHELIFREAYRAFHGLPEIVGWTPWCLMDIRVPMHWRWYNKGLGVFRYGLLDESWNEKRVFRVVKEEIAKLKAHFQ